MTGVLGPDDPGSFDEFLVRFFGPSAGGSRGPVRRVDLTRLMSAAGRELVASAAQLAIDRGDTDLDAQHLLLAATRMEPTRRWLTRADVEPEAIAGMIDERLQPTEPTGRAPSLTPAAQRALLDGHQVARSVRATYIGPSTSCSPSGPTRSRRPGVSWPRRSPSRCSATRTA